MDINYYLELLKTGRHGKLDKIRFMEYIKKHGYDQYFKEEVITIK